MGRDIGWYEVVEERVGGRVGYLGVDFSGFGFMLGGLG